MTTKQPQKAPPAEPVAATAAIDESATTGTPEPENGPDDDWLRLDTVFKMPYDSVRFQCMRGTGRVWACDGEYVACRPKDFHDGTRTRHQGFLNSGHYKHVGTFDDVQIFELLPGSPFRRDNRTLIPGVNLYQDMRECAKAATTRDWVLYHDILEAIATNVKAAYDANMAREMFGDIVTQIRNLIQMRGGPSVAEVDAALANVRKRRGVGVDRKILLPAG